jgi:hypothetical protein
LSGNLFGVYFCRPEAHSALLIRNRHRQQDEISEEINLNKFFEQLTCSQVARKPWQNAKNINQPCKALVVGTLTV